MILQDKTDGVLILTVNRPKQLNALNSKVISQLSALIYEAQTMDDVQVIVLTGSGEKAFVAGADIVEFANFSPKEGENLSALGQATLFDRIEKSAKPVIAAVNGFALGGGLELAMAAHIRIASTNAKLGLPEVSLGVIPGYGGTQRLAQLVGKGRAMEMVLTAGMISAEEGCAYGLVNKVVEQNILMDEVMGIAKKIKRNAPTALTAAINAILAGYTDGVDGYKTEIEEFGKCFGTQDFKEGTTAFIEKRHAKFPGK
ncbi:MAG: enoyl-CoA hydratase [Bacteroidetes bacterium]|nr:MAG: enoyl-CoA hydratase [Bacteroidota bacterium]